MRNMPDYRRGRRPHDHRIRERDIKRALGILMGLGLRASQLAKERRWQNGPEPAPRPAPQESAPQPPMPRLYSGTEGKTAVGIVKIVAGSLLGSVTFLSMLAAVILLFTDGGIFPFLATLALFGGSVGLAVNGIQGLCLVSRFKAYCRALGQRTHCSLEQLARSVGKQEKFVRQDLKKMMDQGLFLEGHLDHEETTLITSHETYRHFEQSRLKFEQQKQLEAQRKAEAEEQAKAEAARKAEKARQAEARDPKIQTVLDQGEAFLAEIRRCNDIIPGEEISQKISRMELIVQKIFHRLESDPEIVDDLKKMMDYYLPMTIKLLRAYADMDAQPVQGQTITASKQEIEQTLDTLNLAFERLLDSIFQETAMDVSSDISVLQTLLAQEGLTEDPLDQIKKNIP